MWPSSVILNSMHIWKKNTQKNITRNFENTSWRRSMSPCYEVHDVYNICPSYISWHIGLHIFQTCTCLQTNQWLWVWIFITSHVSAQEHLEFFLFPRLLLFRVVLILFFSSWCLGQNLSYIHIFFVIYSFQYSSCQNATRRHLIRMLHAVGECFLDNFVQRCCTIIQLIVQALYSKLYLSE